MQLDTDTLVLELLDSLQNSQVQGDQIINPPHKPAS